MRAIFVGGCERSGTTLLADLLGAHPSYLAVPELRLSGNILRAQRSQDGTIDVRDALDQAINGWRARRWKLELRADELPARLSPRELTEIVVRVFGSRVGKDDPAVWIDSTPTNTRFAWHLSRAFPDARIVHIVRDGRAVAASMMDVDWGPNDAAAAARSWLSKLAFGLVAESAEGLAPVIRVHYERLVADPEGTLRELCQRLDLEFHPAMTGGGGVGAGGYDAVNHPLLGRAPDADRIAAWERRLTPRQVEIFESVARDALIYLGYEPRWGIRARPATRMERSAARARGMARRRLNRIRRLRRRAAALP